MADVVFVFAFVCVCVRLGLFQAPPPVQYQQMPVAQPVYQQAQPVYQQQQPVYQQQQAGITFQPAPQAVFVQQPPQVRCAALRWRSWCCSRCCVTALSLPADRCCRLLVRLSVRLSVCVFRRSSTSKLAGTLEPSPRRRADSSSVIILTASRAMHKHAPRRISVYTT